MAVTTSNARNARKTGRRRLDSRGVGGWGKVRSPAIGRCHQTSATQHARPDDSIPHPQMLAISGLSKSGLGRLGQGGPSATAFPDILKWRRCSCDAPDFVELFHDTRRLLAEMQELRHRVAVLGAIIIDLSAGRVP